MRIEKQDPELAMWLNRLDATLDAACLSNMMRNVQAALELRQTPLPRYFLPAGALGLMGATALGLWLGVALSDEIAIRASPIALLLQLATGGAGAVL
jgi:hypothetical protein